MSDDEEGDRVTLRGLFTAALGGRKDAASAAEGTIGGNEPPRDVYLPFEVADRVYIDHNGTRYEVVEAGDGLAVEVADE